MKRNALESFLLAVALAAPMASSGCSGCPNTPPAQTITAIDDAGIASATDGGFLPTAYCAVTCSTSTTDCREVVTDRGQPELLCTQLVSCGGRRPVAWSAEPVDRVDAIEQFFVRSAALEAASVHAFRRLADELRRHGAPDELAQRAGASAAQEVVHARIVGEMARRYGATPVAVRLPEAGERTLLELAIDNAIEGCVRETFGAAVAQWQAATARDKRVRRAMRRIARDEADHARLAWDLRAWMATRLTIDERTLVLAETQRAVARLDAVVVSSSPPRALVDEVGLPTAAQAASIVANGRRTVWNAKPGLVSATSPG